VDRPCDCWPTSACRISNHHYQFDSKALTRVETCPCQVDIRLRLSTINVLTGPIGSGKSTLLRAILGELPLDTESIFVSSNNMTYCAQTLWTLNIPIEKSVSGLTRGQAIKEEWYSKVMHPCALEKDMLQLTDGDQSIPGRRGLTLSGGQKQRVVSAMELHVLHFLWIR
jgi:ATP-binding cassette, subfamily C (CFTR/MRP), member 1